jgi:hypothetical protein
MNRSIMTSALLATLSLVACEKPNVVNVPAAPVAVPGPPGPQGTTGDQGAPGKSGDNTTLIVVPPAASAPVK